MITVREIVAAWLVSNGYDGICSDDCECEVDDLMSCRKPCDSCVAGHTASAGITPGKKVDALHAHGTVGVLCGPGAKRRYISLEATEGAKKGGAR